LALRQVWPPAFPMFLALTRLVQALIFDGQVSGHNGQGLVFAARNRARIFSEEAAHRKYAWSAAHWLRDGSQRGVPSLPSRDRLNTSPQFNILSVDYRYPPRYFAAPVGFKYRASRTEALGIPTTGLGVGTSPTVTSPPPNQLMFLSSKSGLESNPAVCPALRRRHEKNS